MVAMPRVGCRLICGENTPGPGGADSPPRHRAANDYTTQIVRRGQGPPVLQPPLGTLPGGDRGILAHLC